MKTRHGVQISPWIVKMMKMKELPIPSHKWKYYKNDLVEVISGPDKGMKGRILSCVKDLNQVVVEGVNLSKKKLAGNETTSGGAISSEKPIPYNSIALVHPVTGLPTRSKLMKVNGRITRAAIPSGHEIVINRNSDKKSSTYKELGPKDTPRDVVGKFTYQHERSSVYHQVLRALGLGTNGLPFEYTK